MALRHVQEQQLRTVNRVSSDQRTVLDLLRRTPGTQVQEVLSQIREAPSLEDAVGSIADASLLLPNWPLQTFGSCKNP